MKSSAQVPPHQSKAAARPNPYRRALTLAFVGLSASLVLWVANVSFGILPNGHDIQGDLYANSKFYLGYRVISLVFSLLIGAGVFKLTAWKGPAKKLALITRIFVFLSVLYSVGVDFLFTVLQNVLWNVMPMITPILGNFLHHAALFALFIFCAALVDDCGETKRAQSMRLIAKVFLGLSIFFSVYWLRFYVGLSSLPNLGLLEVSMGPVVYGYIYLNTARSLPLYAEEPTPLVNDEP